MWQMITVSSVHVKQLVKGAVSWKRTGNILFIGNAWVMMVIGTGVYVSKWCTHKAHYHVTIPHSESNPTSPYCRCVDCALLNVKPSFDCNLWVPVGFQQAKSIWKLAESHKSQKACKQAGGQVSGCCSAVWIWLGWILLLLLLPGGTPPPARDTHRHTNTHCMYVFILWRKTLGIHILVLYSSELKNMVSYLTTCTFYCWGGKERRREGGMDR